MELVKSPKAPFKSYGFDRTANMAPFALYAEKRRPAAVHCHYNSKRPGTLRCTRSNAHYTVVSRPVSCIACFSFKSVNTRIRTDVLIEQWNLDLHYRANFRSDKGRNAKRDARHEACIKGDKGQYAFKNN